MKIIDRYLLKNLGIATLFIAVILSFIIFLTQSLRFLELVINAGGTGSAFWLLTLLALPRFLEIILPLAMMAATLFLYNKMSMDSEIISMRAVGYSPLALARPTLILGAIVTITLWAMTLWISPASMAQMQKMRVALTAEFSNILFREGVFNPIGKGLTVYIKERTSNGELAGIMIHDTRDETIPPSTILAKRGMMIMNENGPQVVVFDGSKQEFNQKNHIIQNLSFDRYTIDLPDSGPVQKRWAEPDERNIFELLNPDLNNPRDVDNLREFSVEIHRRFTSPLLAFAFPLIALNALLIGPMDRRGQVRRIAAALAAIILIQGLFLVAYSMAKNNVTGLVLMYLLTLLPIAAGIFSLSSASEQIRRDFISRNRLRMPA